MKLYALKFVRYERVEDHFRLGWIMSFPNGSMHHHTYGCELAWICPCPIPGGFSNHRVPETSDNRGNHERTGA